MDSNEDIEFLKEFREKIDKYLFLGYAPSEGSLFADIEGSAKMKQALKNPEFQELRRTINEMKPRVEQLLVECDLSDVFVMYRPPAAGGQVVQFKMFNLITENPTHKRLPKETFFDVIDQAIGMLKTNPPEKRKSKVERIAPTIIKGLIFIAMPMGLDDSGLEDVHDTIKDVASEDGFEAKRVDDPESNQRITPRILEWLKKAEFVIADLTHSKPNVYFEAGYAEAMGNIPIYIAKEGTQIEFDVKDCPVIFFKNLRELKTELSKRLTGLKEGSQKEQKS